MSNGGVTTLTFFLEKLTNNGLTNVQDENMVLGIKKI